MALDHSVPKMRPVLGNTYKIEGFHLASGVFLLIVSY